MNAQEVNNIALSIDRDVKVIETFTLENIDLSNQEIVNQALKISETVDTQITSVEVSLNTVIIALQYNALYRISHVIYGGGIGLLVFIFNVIVLIKRVWDTISIILSVINIIKAFHIDDLLYEWWPWYAGVVDQVRTLIVDISESLDWGVDGLMHLMNAVSGTVSIYGGLTGKSKEWMRLQWLNKQDKALKRLKIYTDMGRTSPEDLLGFVFQHVEFENMEWYREWGGENLERFENIAGIVEKAVRDAGFVSDELLAIQENMPQVIADNIPASIWSGLESFNNTIYNDILPTVSAINEKIKEANRLIDMYAGQMTNIAKKLLKPGDLLLGVDNLIDPVRLLQEAAIDDVASREFQRAADQGRDALDDDLGEFDRIDNALKAGTPPPVFMTLEDPKRRAILGIEYEPGETWFLTADL